MSMHFNVKLVSQGVNDARKSCAVVMYNAIQRNHLNAHTGCFSWDVDQRNKGKCIGPST